MKKIIPILFLFFLCVACYLIYSLTEKKDLTITSIGDKIAANDYLKKMPSNVKYNYEFTNKDYRIIDLLNIIKYNQELSKNEKKISIHQLLKASDILIISIGMNDIDYKLYDDTKEIYTYLNTMISNYEILLKEINHYTYKQVFIIGYYNLTNKNNDIYTYVNYKLKVLTEKYHYTFIDTNKLLNNNSIYLEKKDNYNLNQAGYYQIYNFIVEKIKKS